MNLFVLFAAFCSLGIVAGQHDPHFTQSRSAIVHLFEWRWNDIADECERFLAPYGYGGVQTSPPNENRIEIVGNTVRPWWERYQPVSYKLDTRSGTEEEFRNMVRRCNAVGVRIYNDLVINHMTMYNIGAGKGTAGTQFDAATMNYPGYSADDFNVHGECSTPSGEIDDYQNVNQMRNCRLGGLLDLNQGKPNVRNQLVGFLNKLVSYGVAGFRVDAAKHMWPADLKAIFDRLDNLPVDQGFPAGSRPFVYQEVIDFGADNIHVDEYFHIGRVTEFKPCGQIGRVLSGGDKMAYLRNWGEGWDYMPSSEAVVFVDNHDNQRTGIHDGILTFRKDRLYKMAQEFFLAWPYGIPRVMSSFFWEQDVRDEVDWNAWMGPPHDANYNVLPVTVNPDNTCNNGWVCEHRWRPIYGMAKFRNVVGDAPVEHWWDNGNNQIAFSRGNRGFIVFNNQDIALYETLQTGLPAGEYCDVITGDLINGRCGGRSVVVGQDGKATIFISNLEADPVIAIHLESKFA